MTDYSNMVATKNFSLTIKHIGMLAEMERMTGKNPSELARIALENLFEKLNVEADTQPTAQTAA